MTHTTMYFALCSCGVNFSVGNGQAWKESFYLLCYSLQGVLVLF